MPSSGGNAVRKPPISRMYLPLGSLPSELADALEPVADYIEGGRGGLSTFPTEWLAISHSK